ncbi:transposase (plasmid) [Fulvitalea axinellae]|uniref:Transposase n=1 Tax=Fulvitalea axinellae TaxID=1182444 RepID=A0AAU9CUY6_9BACT|nr:transposase [Fulvitalea axinellae]
MTVLDTLKLTEIFIASDDFCKRLDEYHKEKGIGNQKKSGRPATMSDSEIMTVLIFFHLSGIRCFKWYYNNVLMVYLRSYFPDLPDYTTFLTASNRVFAPMTLFMQAVRLSPRTGHNYVDSKPLAVCHNKRIKQHRVFAGIAKRGKSSMGWFFGFKLHAVINEYGQLVVVRISSGNVSDNNHKMLRSLTKDLQGFLYGDKGYISKLRDELRGKGLTLVTKLRSKMRPKEMLAEEQKHYLKHRRLIESAFDILKHVCQIEHSRHRSVKGFLINTIAALLAYTFLDKTPECPKFPKKLGKWDRKMTIELI